jgi:hypothetical protein
LGATTGSLSGSMRREKWAGVRRPAAARACYTIVEERGLLHTRLGRVWAGRQGSIRGSNVLGGWRTGVEEGMRGSHIRDAVWGRCGFMFKRPAILFLHLCHERIESTAEPAARHA